MSILVWALIMPGIMFLGLVLCMAVAAAFGAIMAFLCGLEDNDDFD